MIVWDKVNKLDEEINNKRVELIQAPTEEEKNAIKAEIKYLEKQKNSQLGKKECSRTRKVRNTDSKEIEQQKTKYYEFKETESRINPFSVAVKRFLRKIMKRTEKNQSKLVVIKNESKGYTKKAS